MKTISNNQHRMLNAEVGVSSSATAAFTGVAGWSNEATRAASPFGVQHSMFSVHHFPNSTLVTPHSSFL